MSRKPFPFPEFEPRWQRRWLESGAFRAPNPGEPGFDAARPKYYVLDMFPYPSGEGLHVGHVEGYTATDILARTKRMQGFNVLHPMGWDAFGLPAEQFAIKTGQHPRVTTERNVARFREQLQGIGFSYDWSREISTTDPAYFRWTQWIFLQLYGAWFNPATNRAEPIGTYGGGNPDDVRLAYIADRPVNWCPELGTVLANEEVVDGKSEVGGFAVERRPMRQWMLRITDYAQRLIDELDGLDWPDSIKLLQRNWIGRSEGASVTFAVEAGSAGAPRIEVFTTRPDTLFGATYMVLAPEHPLVEAITTAAQGDAVADYRRKVSSKSDLERTDLAREKSGVFTGAHAVNPVNGARIPVWVADYVLMGYGTGAIMAVPAHDERDFEFAETFGLPVKRVVEPGGIGFQPMSPQAPVTVREGAQLPHWSQNDATYAVTFCLIDSLPAVARQEIDAERAQFERQIRDDREFTAADHAAGRRLFSEKVESSLDAGAGECWLRRPEIGEIVAKALRRFEGERYRLMAWCVMPNHVHAVVRPLGAHSLSEIVHSWKSFSAGAVNKVLGREGALWQGESYDHLIRDQRDLEAQIRYVRENPGKAGLVDWRWADHRLEADATVVGAAVFSGEGVAVNSGFLDGLPTAEAKRKIIAWLEEQGAGAGRVNYKLRDWLFSRQRYWGEPFPILWAGGEHGALPESELPLVQPEMADFKPTGTGEPPLAKATGWVRYSEAATRETNTMPQWAGSCWYYLRFCDPGNAERFAGKEAEGYWMGTREKEKREEGNERSRSEDQKCPGGVDLYVGGTEHAVLHLLYARFWHKVLFDLGHVSTPEPFRRLVNQGIILGGDGVKMSKSRGNVVSPDEVIAEFGADSLRLYEMFMGPLEQMKPWSMKGVEGVFRFLARVWRLGFEENQEGEWRRSPALREVEFSSRQARVVHAAIKKVTEDVEALSFNTAIAQMMVFVNEFTGVETRPLAAVRMLLTLLSPFAPHLAEEMWTRLEFGGLASAQSWPEFDERFLVEDEVEIVLQVNGKLRDRVVISKSATKEDIEALALANEKVREATEGKTVVKVVAVPGKLANIVVR